MAKNRNELISDIVVALAGDPSGATRNDLLQAWKDSLDAPLWTPAQLTSTLWLDASDATTISESGGYVSQWDDKSGNGNNAFQSLASKQPQTGIDTIGGLNAISFNFDLLLLDSLVDFSQYKNQELFVVMQANDNGADKAFFAQNDGGSDCFLHRYSYNNMNIVLFANTSSGSLKFIATPQTNLTSEVIYSSYITSSKIAVKIAQATSYTSTNLPSNIADSTSQVSIGARNTGSNAFNGKIAEIIFIPNTLSSDDRLRMEGYLAWKWSLEADLSASHPYKSQPPRI